MSGRSAFLKLLIDEGVTHLFGNPGTTELAIMEVVPDFPELNFVLGLQEAVVVGMADGYARASNRLAAVSLHVAVQAPQAGPLAVGHSPSDSD